MDPYSGYVTERIGRHKVAWFRVEVDGVYRRFEGTIGLSPGTKAPTWFIWRGAHTPATKVKSLADALAGMVRPPPDLGTPTWFPACPALSAIQDAASIPTWFPTYSAAQAAKGPDALPAYPTLPANQDPASLALSPTPILLKALSSG
jgi:hypothetical protein